MKKVIISAIVLMISSCTIPNKIYYSKNVKKSIHNLEQMQSWLHEDFAHGAIEREVANNYMVVIINTKCSLYKKIKEKHTDCTD
tara:strand:+ start:99 stop:350 length:252 start_codon:yes stop_codon:yes gene_type:complete